MAEPVHPLKLASVLLQYPDDARVAAAAEAVKLAIEPANRRQIANLRRFCGWYSSRPQASCAACTSTRSTSPSSAACI